MMVFVEISATEDVMGIRIISKHNRRVNPPAVETMCASLSSLDRFSVLPIRDGTSMTPQAETVCSSFTVDVVEIPTTLDPWRLVAGSVFLRGRGLRSLQSPPLRAAEMGERDTVTFKWTKEAVKHLSLRGTMTI